MEDEENQHPVDGNGSDSDSESEYDDEEVEMMGDDNPNMDDGNDRRPESESESGDDDDDEEVEMMRVDNPPMNDDGNVQRLDAAEFAVNNSKQVLNLLEAVTAAVIEQLPAEIITARQKKVLIEKVLQPTLDRGAIRRKLTSVRIREFADNEKLKSCKNWQTWKDLFFRELEENNLCKFVEERQDLTQENSPRDMLTRQLIRACTTPHVWSYVAECQSAFDAYQKLDELYNTPTLNAMMRILTADKKLVFKRNFNRDRFVADFERIMADYAAVDCSFPPMYTVIQFISKIRGTRVKFTPLNTFYEMVMAIPPDMLNYETVKKMFLELDLSEPYPLRAGAKRKRDDRESSEEPAEKKLKPGDETSVKSLTSKYTLEQMAELGKMTEAEKRRIRCKKCSEYFHSAKSCPNPGRLCFGCYKYGHERRLCPMPKFKKSSKGTQPMETI